MSSESRRLRSRDVPDAVNKVSGHVLHAAIEVHQTLGPGLEEGAYRDCLGHELALRHFRVHRETQLDLAYKGLVRPGAYRTDFVIDGVLAVDVKAAPDLRPVDEASLQAYLRVSGLPMGVLLNFHTPATMEGGIRRVLRRVPATARDAA